jgi:hypothetical protein
MNVKNKLIRFTFLIILLYHPVSHAQQNDSTEVIPWRLYLVGGVTAGAFTFGHLFQENIWWKGERSGFHFNWHEDWVYALGGDKLGHIFFPYMVTTIYTDVFEWTGLTRKQSLYYAASLAFAYQTYVEIRDGFSAEWGFSWGDFGANVIGAAYPILQEHYPSLKNYNMKINFHASERFKQGSHAVIIDDYESTYHWLTVTTYNLLPDNWKQYYPSFVNFAIGHSVQNLDYNGKHELYLALDWNFEMLPGDFWLWKIIKRLANFYRFPSPAVRITPTVVWYGLRF